MLADGVSLPALGAQMLAGVGSLDTLDLDILPEGAAARAGSGMGELGPECGGTPR